MTSSPRLSRAISTIGHALREAATLPQAFDRSGNPRLAVFPSGTNYSSGDLRGRLLGQELRKHGWSTMVVPVQLEAFRRKRLLRLFRPDLLLFQTCRHSLNDPDHAFGYPWVLDLDDADFHDDRARDRLERTAAGAVAVIAGSRYICDWARNFNSNARVIWTGTPRSGGTVPDHSVRPPVVAWAQGSPLGYKAELDFIRALHARLVARGEMFTLRLYGISRPEERDQIRSLFPPQADLELFPFMEYHDFLGSLRDVAVGLSPIIPASPFSRGKSFGKILGYLDAGVPVVCSDEADHALFFNAANGVVSNDPDVWVEAISRLLKDPSARNAMSGLATRDFRAKLTIEMAAHLTDRLLRPLVRRSSDHG